MNSWKNQPPYNPYKHGTASNLYSNSSKKPGSAAAYKAMREANKELGRVGTSLAHDSHAKGSALRKLSVAKESASHQLRTTQADLAATRAHAFALEKKNNTLEKDLLNAMVNNSTLQMDLNLWKQRASSGRPNVDDEVETLQRKCASLEAAVKRERQEKVDILTKLEAAELEVMKLRCERLAAKKEIRKVTNNLKDIENATVEFLSHSSLSDDLKKSILESVRSAPDKIIQNLLKAMKQLELSVTHDCEDEDREGPPKKKRKKVNLAESDDEMSEILSYDAFLVDD
ncbi:hypothetical protein AAVH_03182 [Aphelenchoides avenae]|nr:hypothetical protein AAVH_03182 [Aphelenchus avenae]